MRIAPGQEIPPETPRRRYCGAYLSFATLCLLAGQQVTARNWISQDPSFTCTPIEGSLRLRERDGAIEYVDARDVALTRSLAAGTGR